MTNSKYNRKTSNTKEKKKVCYLKIEIWKDINGYEDSHQVSNLGRIKRKAQVRKRMSRNGMQDYTYKELIMRQSENSTGYYRVELNGSKSSERLFVHRIVAETFLEKIDGKDIVNHIDGDRKNNKSENLEWVTLSENSIHSIYVLKNTPNISGLNQEAPVFKIDKESGEVLERYNTITEASRSNGNTSHISAVCRGERNTAGGYKWKYAS